MNLFDHILFADLRLAEWILNLRTMFLDKFFLEVTYWGNWQVILFLCLLFSILFYFNKKKYLILPLFVSVIGAGVMTVIIKYIVGRARPNPEIALYVEKLPSFPSAHSALIFSLFGFLFYSICRSNLDYKIKFTLSVVVVFIIIIVGFSRLYLGVHFLSDVLAGYLVGLMWVLTSMYISRKNIFK